jgi:3-oxoacyl-[acyl-carrier-protein] synthase-1
VIYIGSETILGPNGNLKDCFRKIAGKKSGVSKITGNGFNGESFYCSMFLKNRPDFNTLAAQVIEQLLQKSKANLLSEESTLLIISTTKGDLSIGFENAIVGPAKFLYDKFKLKHFPFIISNACASGVMAINAAAAFIENKQYQNVIVLGVDMISNFIVYGFQSLYAISDEPCKPFDSERKGINLGEGAGAVLLSSNKDFFTSTPVCFLGGSSSNDANHISGPSRTGEGLFRSINKTLSTSAIKPKEIDFISAHGTATVFNDEMEAIAFNRLNMQHIPTNSFKGFTGHTLGAAGVIETALCIACMHENTLLPSAGYDNQGTSVELNIIKETISASLTTVLKTASGFGGCNASLILQKIR